MYKQKTLVMLKLIALRGPILSCAAEIRFSTIVFLLKDTLLNPFGTYEQKGMYDFRNGKHTMDRCSSNTELSNRIWSLWYQNRDYHFIAQLCRGNSQTLLMPLHLVVDQIVTSIHVSGCYKIFFQFTLKKYFMLKNSIFFKFKILYVLKIYFNCFNNQINNLDNMEGEKLFYRQIKQYFENIKWLAISRRGNLWTKFSIQQIS